MGRGSPVLYHARVAEWLRNQSNASSVQEHRHVNAGTPAIGPEYTEKCLDSQMAEPPDLVLVEFSQNLQGADAAAALERLIRRLLLLPTSPAVVLVDLPTWTSLEWRHDAHRAAVPKLAAHYGLPYVSVQWLVERLDSEASARVQAWKSGGWLQCGDINSRGCRNEAAPHPNILGHELIAAAVARLLHRAWVAPVPAASSLAVPAPLMTRLSTVGFSSELFRGRWHASVSSKQQVPNYELDSAVCVGPQQLPQYVKYSSGWELVQEGSKLHPKPGYVASNVGENDLALCYPVTSVCSDRGACVGRTVLAAIGYLKSYDPAMGQATVHCTDGCSCEENHQMSFDGFNNERSSVTWVSWLALNLTAAAFRQARTRCPCTVHVSAGPRRKGSSHYRFKVSMMMLSHQGDMSWVDPWKTKWQSIGDSEPKRRRERRLLM